MQVQDGDPPKYEPGNIRAWGDEKGGGRGVAITQLSQPIII